MKMKMHLLNITECSEPQWPDYSKVQDEGHHGNILRFSIESEEDCLHKHTMHIDLGKRIALHNCLSHQDMFRSLWLEEEKRPYHSKHHINLRNVIENFPHDMELQKVQMSGLRLSQLQQGRSVIIHYVPNIRELKQLLKENDNLDLGILAVIPTEGPLAKLQIWSDGTLISYERKNHYIDAFEVYEHTLHLLETLGVTLGKG